jgi:ATP-dependent Lon protease
VLIPKENVKDLQEIPEEVKNAIEITPVQWFDEVLERALERKPEPLADSPVAAPPPAPEVRPVVTKH